MEANKNRSIDALHSFFARTKTGLPAKTGHAAYRLRSIRRFNELDLIMITCLRSIDVSLLPRSQTEICFRAISKGRRSLMNSSVQRIGSLAAFLVAGTIVVCWRTETAAAGPGDPKAVATCVDQPETKIVSSWDQKAAAAYLDQRQSWWMEWPKAARDHETFCVSCHTAVPYALSRPALRKALAEQAPSMNERRLLDNVTKRVRLWKEIAPFYSDADRGAYKTAESRGTESVLNALILASNEAQSPELSNDARAALDNMWAEQQVKGSKKEIGRASCRERV